MANAVLIVFSGVELDNVTGGYAPRDLKPLSCGELGALGGLGSAPLTAVAPTRMHPSDEWNMRRLVPAGAIQEGRKQGCWSTNGSAVTEPRK